MRLIEACSCAVYGGKALGRQRSHLASLNMDDARGHQRACGGWSGFLVRMLAASLGVGPRHLSRLFDKHLGASPGQIAKTARMQRAKRLLDDTKLPMIEVALLAGFHSLRRFNAVFAEVYKRPPTDIRRAQRNR
jgi:AraC-like DNA-binding protein